MSVWFMYSCGVPYIKVIILLYIFNGNTSKSEKFRNQQKLLRLTNLEIWQKSYHSKALMNHDIPDIGL